MFPTDESNKCIETQFLETEEEIESMERGERSTIDANCEWPCGGKNSLFFSVVAKRMLLVI